MRKPHASIVLVPAVAVAAALGVTGAQAAQTGDGHRDGHGHHGHDHDRDHAHHHAHHHGHRHGDHARFRVELEPVNQDGRGDVRISKHHGHLEVRLKAKHLDGGVHLAHIHGIRQAQNECPDHDFDVDDNGLIDIEEGLPAYGPVQITLSDGLNDTGTRIEYTRFFGQLDDGSPIRALGRLTQYAVVVHGVDLDGDGVATNPDTAGDATEDANAADDNEISMPALCGTIERH